MSKYLNKKHSRCEKRIPDAKKILITKQNEEYLIFATSNGMSPNSIISCLGFRNQNGLCDNV